MEERLIELDPARRRSWLKGKLGTLAIGDTLEVAYPTADLSELRDLQSDLPEIDWYPVELLETETVIDFVRRAADSRDQKAVIAFMRADHEQLHRLLVHLRELVAREDRAEATAVLHRLSSGMHRHFTMEEELLLPIIARRLISPRGPAAVLRDEHVRILEHLLGIEAWLVQGDLAAAAQELAVFERFLGRHAAMEDQVLYAITDGLLTEAERAAVVAECQRVELQPL